jgi:hypothetical protein
MRISLLFVIFSPKTEPLTIVDEGLKELMLMG